MKTFLILSIFVSALATIWIRHEHRLTFIQLQTLEKQRDKLEQEWEQLQLEQSTWSQPQRIEQLAKEKLQMKIPNSEDIFFIKLPK
ncbi:MAG: cell division protein FtsL [Pseudomonadota bacterium]|jgi:cell division protein FtsL